MSEPTKLTPEQVAAFEARAAAGERPVLEWDTRPAGTFSRHDTGLGFRLRVDDYGGYNQFQPGVSVPGASNSLGDDCPKLGSMVAAQLAAEHLLREATRALHPANAWEADHQAECL